MTDTGEQLAQSIKRALEHKMTPEEIWEQRVSFVYGQQDSDSTHRFTKDQIREKLAKIYGYTPVRREGDAGGAVRSMTDISEQLGGHTQPVLRTVREKLWIDPEVVARVRGAMLQQPYIKRARNEPAHWLIEVRLSDVNAMLAALAVPIATR